MTTNSKPYHRHDCADCIYLGSTMLNNGALDWYRHDESILARAGNKGSNYWSSLISVVNDDKYLVAQHGDKRVLVGMNVLARFMLNNYETKGCKL